MVSSNRLFVAFGTVCTCQPDTCRQPHLAANELPHIALVSAEIPPGAGGIPVKRREMKLQLLVNKEDPFVIGCDPNQYQNPTNRMLRRRFS
jgi:hypothetical protein